MKYSLELWLFVIFMTSGMIILIPFIFIKNCCEYLYLKLTNNKEMLEIWEGD